DYANDIRIGAWYPIVSAPFTNAAIEDFKGVKCDFSEGRKAVDSGFAYFLAVNGSGSYIFPADKPGVDYTIDMQSKLLAAFAPVDVHYVQDYYYKSELVNGNTVLMRRHYDSQAVWEEALKGKLFPPKSTRHEFLRAKLDIPLEWLKLPFEEANGLLQETLGRVKQNFEQLTSNLEI
ncbi:MAG TPA: hypothetical protein PLO51_05200, partial [Candidatus Micrarchaeota archaeon]|nr:hypothetical protein [Candidatus Micrarchaeota archaeon]